MRILGDPDEVLCALRFFECFVHLRKSVRARDFTVRKPVVCGCSDELTSSHLVLLHKNNRHRKNGIGYSGDPDEIRTRVTAVKGRCLRPLDHRAILVAVIGFEPMTLRV